MLADIAYSIDPAPPDVHQHAAGLLGRPASVLVIDEDPLMQQTLASFLKHHNMRVLRAVRRHDVTRQLTRTEPSVVILDLDLGQEDGLDLLRELRARSDVPVIITSGHHRDEIDRVVGLELGADHYVIKPFGLRELLARIQAVLRRQKPGRIVSHRDTEQGSYRFAGWLLDRHTRRLTNPSGTLIALTKGEYGLLIAFLNAPQRPLSREHLLQATRIHEDVFDRSIDVQILRLRRKLEPDPSTPRLIRTERGVGYVLMPAVERV